MSLAIHILVGTMTGTAELVAQELELAHAAQELSIDVTLMDDLDCSVFPAARCVPHLYVHIWTR